MKELEYRIAPLDAATLSGMDLESLSLLAEVLSSNFTERISAAQVITLLSTGTTTIFVARELAGGRIIGMATLVISPQLLRGKGWLEDVAVLSDYMGHGIGRMLTIAVIELAKKLGLTKLDLTSSHARGTAHNLYEGLGWHDRDSRLMRLVPATFDTAALDLSMITLPA